MSLFGGASGRSSATSLSRFLSFRNNSDVTRSIRSYHHFPPSCGCLTLTLNANRDSQLILLVMGREHADSPGGSSLTGGSAPAVMLVYLPLIPQKIPCQ